MSLVSKLFRSFILVAMALLAAPLASHAVILTPQEQAIANYLGGSGQHRPFLQLDDTLTAVARSRAADMARRGYFAHVNPDGYGPNALVRQAGYKLPDWWGTSNSANYVESIAAGRSNASSTWSDWMNSAPHKTHLLAEESFYADQTSYGVGFAAVPGSPYTYYWVVITAPPQPVPLLSVVSPAAGLRVLTPSAPVNGTTAGTPAAQSVVFRVENTTAGAGSFVAATGAAVWAGTANGLAPGYNNIRIRSLDGAGAVLAEVNRLVFYVVNKPLTVNVNGPGSVTAGFAGTTTRELGAGYSITATPSATGLFTGWTGSLPSNSPTLNFYMAEGLQLTANFVPNPFLTRSGGYIGPISGTRPGGMRIVLNGTGGFSGGIRYEGVNYGVTGLFSPDGNATVQIPRTGQSALTLTLHLDVSGNSGVTGTVTDGSKTASVSGTSDVKASDGKFSGAGKYTIVVPAAGDLSDSDTPQGNSFLTLTVDGYGRAFIRGYLADGSYVEVWSLFSSGNVLNFLIPLYGGYGEFAGSLTLRSSNVSDLDGTMNWYRPAYAPSPISPGGFSLSGPLVGSIYTPPAPGAPALQVPTSATNAVLGLGGGDLPQDVSQPGTLASNNIMTMKQPAFSNFYAGINPADGTFGAIFVHPVTGAVSYVGGVVLQKQNAGYGAFVGKNETGYATLRPAGQ